MSTQYFRITAYDPSRDMTVIIDSNGAYEKLWQFSAFLLQKGLKIIDVSNEEKFLDVNITKVNPSVEQIFLRAYAKGNPTKLSHTLGGVTYPAIKVGEKIYIPDITITAGGEK